jgi:glycosyltransferase involved in cell wall biosynthesis
MKIWILQTGEPLHVDKSGLRPMRAMNLSNALIEKGHNVVLWSSDFDHFSKKNRFGGAKEIEYSSNLKIKLVPSWGYKSHISIARFLDHLVLAFNLNKELKTQNIPDVAFIGYPPIETAWVLARWLRKNNVPFLVDIKDAWPDIFIAAIPRPLKNIARVLFAPQFIMMKKVLYWSTGISAPTQRYLRWCQSRSGRQQNKQDRVTPITAPNTLFNKDELQKAEAFLDGVDIKNDGTFRVCFIGTLNSNYDFQPVIKAALNLPIQFVIAGEGPIYWNLKKDCEEIKNIKLIGWVDSVTSDRIYDRSNLAIAPYKDSFDFQMNITNKFYDAMLHKKPILTSLNGAAEDLLKDYKIGVKYNRQDVSDLTRVLSSLLKNPILIRDLSENAINTYMSIYSSEIVYSELVSDLEKLSNNV